MACLGVHFAITEDDLILLQNAKSDREIIEVIQEEIEERWEKDARFVYETDKAWDAIHRCLTNENFEINNGLDLLHLCILGGEQLYKGDHYIVSFIHNDNLRNLADSLALITVDRMRERYNELSDDYDGEKGEEDFDYTWDWFSELPEFFDRAEQSGRHVIFTVDQ